MNGKEEGQTLYRYYICGGTDATDKAKQACFCIMAASVTQRCELECTEDN